MTLKGEACRLTIYVGEDDQWHHKPLYTEIVHRAHVFGRTCLDLMARRCSEAVQTNAR